MRRFDFWWRYLRRNTPWDTQIVPPEVVDLAAKLRIGRALDLGCGTGTSSIFLAERGWQVVGVDFILAAIQRARLKVRNKQVKVDFYVADASALDFLYEPFDFVLDIGCLHTLPPEKQHGYAAHLTRLTRPNAVYALYAFAPRELNGQRVGLSAEDVVRLFVPNFSIEHVVNGQDKGNGPASAWYTLRRLAAITN